jgi:hypothetical protein
LVLACLFPSFGEPGASTAPVIELIEVREFGVSAEEFEQGRVAGREEGEEVVGEFFRERLFSALGPNWVVARVRALTKLGQCGFHSGNISRARARHYARQFDTVDRQFGGQPRLFWPWSIFWRQIRLLLKKLNFGCGVRSPPIVAPATKSVKPNNPYCQIVRWNGRLGDFTLLDARSVGVVNGDVVKATAVGSTITCYINNSGIFSVNDTTYPSGNPGMGSYLQDGLGPPLNYGFSSYTASDGTPTPNADTDSNTYSHTDSHESGGGHFRRWFSSKNQLPYFSTRWCGFNHFQTRRQLLLHQTAAIPEATRRRDQRPFEPHYRLQQYIYDIDGRPFAVRYAMLLNEFLKEHRKVEQLEKQDATLTAGLQRVSAQLELSKPEPQTALNDQ